MKKTHLELFTAIYGTPVQTPMYEYGNGKSILYIQGGIHGGEVTYFILHKLSKYLSEIESDLKGKVTIVPICNPVAWNQRVYYYTVGKFDLYKGKDWNRSYPGNTDTTLSARISMKLYNIASENEIVVDLHTARNSKPYSIFMSKKSKDVIELLGLKYNLYIDQGLEKNKAYAGTLNDALAKKGLSEVTIECGPHDSYDEASIGEVFNSLVKLIEAKCMKKDVSAKKSKQFQFSNVKTLYSPISCFASYDLPPQSSVKKDQKIMTLYPSDNISKEENFLAPFDGLLFELPKTHIVWEGDELVKIIPETDIVKF